MNTKSHKSKFAFVTTTVDSKVKAATMARNIVASRLAACVQFVSIGSVYRWKGKVESASEYLLLAKTRCSLARNLIAFIKEHHSYELPEIAVVPITDGLQEYLGWIIKETGPIRTQRSPRVDHDGK